MSNNIVGYFPKNISNKQASDTGMAMVLILLIVGLVSGAGLYYKIAVAVLVVNMIYPMVYYPLAVIWLGLSALLGTLSSKLILTVVYVVFVIPVGLFRRLLGKDSLSLKLFKKGTDSVMKTRNYSFKARDIEKPY